MTHTIKVYGKEITARNGNRFIAFTSNIGGIWYKIKFRKECVGVPNTSGVYDIEVTADKMSIQKGKKYTTATGKEGFSNDVLWIESYTNIRKYSDEELHKQSTEKVESLFNDNYTEVKSNEPLPF